MKLTPGGSISPTFFAQLLCVQIPKVQKYSQAISVFALLGFLQVKAEHKMLKKLTTIFDLFDLRTSL